MTRGRPPRAEASPGSVLTLDPAALATIVAALKGEAKPAERETADAASESSTILYGVPAIAKWLGLTQKQTRHRVQRGQIPSFRIGSTICCTTTILTMWLGEQTQSMGARA